MGLPEVGQGLSWNSQEEREIDMSLKWVSQVIPEETGMKNYIRDHVLNCLPCQPLILPDRENKGLTGSPCPLSPLVHPPAFGACFSKEFRLNLDQLERFHHHLDHDELEGAHPASTSTSPKSVRSSLQDLDDIASLEP